MGTRRGGESTPRDRGPPASGPAWMLQAPCSASGGPHPGPLDAPVGMLAGGGHASQRPQHKSKVLVRCTCTASSVAAGIWPVSQHVDETAVSDRYLSRNRTASEAGAPGARVGPVDARRLQKRHKRRRAGAPPPQTRLDRRRRPRATMHPKPDYTPPPPVVVRCRVSSPETVRQGRRRGPSPRRRRVPARQPARLVHVEIEVRLRSPPSPAPLP